MKQFHNKRHHIRRLCLIICCCNIIVLGQSSFLSYANTNHTVMAAKQTKKTAKLSCKSKKIVKNKSFLLKVANVSEDHYIAFETEDPNIACITSTYARSCKVKGLSIGKTKIIVNIYENNQIIKSLKCKLTVTPPAVSVRFRTTDVTMTVDETLSLLPLITLKPKNTAEVPSFTVSNPALLQIDKKDKVTALGIGTVKVTATIKNGKSDVLTIYIVENKE